MLLEEHIQIVLHQDNAIATYTGIGHVQAVVATITKIILSTLITLRIVSGAPHYPTNGHVKAVYLNYHDKIFDTHFKKDHVDSMAHPEDKDENDMDIIPEVPKSQDLKNQHNS